MIILAEFAAGTSMPTVLTSSQETNVNVQGPLMPEVLPDAFAARIKRQGVVNDWDDPAFADAVRGTGRKKLVMAGVTTDVCMVAPAISAVEEGFDVQVVCDACGSTNQIAEVMSWRRMERAGCGSQARMRWWRNLSAIGPRRRARSLSRCWWAE